VSQGGAREGAGQPTKLNAEVSEKICQAIRAGNYMETAAAYAGIAKPTLYNWLKRGRDEPDTIYGALVEAVELAVAEAEVRDVALIAKAADDGVWQASAWRLERRYPDRYGRRTRHDVSGRVDVRPTPYLDVSKLTGDELATLTGLLRKATPEELPKDGKPALELLPAVEQ
jgi:hypothetical protein